MSTEKKKIDRPASGAVLVSTTEGRARLPDLLQTSFGEKTVFGFERYGRAVGALVPMEAVRMLANLGEHVDADVRARIQRAAIKLLHETPNEAERLGLTENEPPFTQEDIALARHVRRKAKTLP